MRFQLGGNQLFGRHGTRTNCQGLLLLSFDLLYAYVLDDTRPKAYIPHL